MFGISNLKPQLPTQDLRPYTDRVVTQFDKAAANSILSLATHGKEPQLKQASANTEQKRIEVQAAQKHLDDLKKTDLRKLSPEDREQVQKDIRQAQAIVQAKQQAYQDALLSELRIARETLPPAFFEHYVSFMQNREAAAATESGDFGDLISSVEKAFSFASIFEDIKQLEAAEAKVADIKEQIRSSPESRQDALIETLKAAEDELKAAKQAYQFDTAVNATNETNDPGYMNGADFFRQSLSPEAQKAYDVQLEKLRNDDRINFSTTDGSSATLVEKELALRGMLAASFGTPETLEQAISDATEKGNKKFDIVFESSNFKPSKYGYAPPSEGKEGNAAGLFTPDADIVIDRHFLVDSAKKNDNPLVHEFSHALQSAGEDSKTLPENFSAKEQEDFQRYFESSAVRKLLDEIGLNHDWGGEAYPTIQNLFRQRPEELKQASPELYRLMVANSGFDPLSGNLTAKVTVK